MAGVPVKTAPAAPSGRFALKGPLPLAPGVNTKPFHSSAPPFVPGTILARRNDTKARLSLIPEPDLVRRSMLGVMSTPLASLAAKVKFTVTGTLSPLGAPKSTEVMVIVAEPVGRGFPVVGLRRCIAWTLNGCPAEWQRKQVSFDWSAGPGPPGGPGGPAAPGAPGAPAAPSEPLHPKNRSGTISEKSPNHKSVFLIFSSFGLVGC